ncbi:MAG TPA: hypothetical protein VGF84_08470 [Micromonosporaceae bacterium]
MTTDPLQDLLAFAGSFGTTLRAADLDRLSSGIADQPAGEFIDAITRVCALSWTQTQPRPGDWLEGVPSWRIELDEDRNRDGLLVGLLAMLVGAAKISDASPTWLIRYLPDVLDLDAIETTVDGDVLSIRVPRRRSVHDDPAAAMLSAQMWSVLGIACRTHDRVSLTIVDGTRPPPTPWA